MDISSNQPQNGLKGLKYWRSDILAGFMVAMISTPFSIGIAVASGAPPVTGLISAIIAGFVLPFLGGSFVTISGPAAGLAPVLYNSMLSLGAGSLAVGYPLLLPVILVAGCIQILISLFKVARFSSIFPIAVVEGMLAAIGMLIIVKQLPILLGHKYLAHEFWGMVQETPHEILLANPKVLAIGIFTLALIFVIAAAFKNQKWIKVVPPSMIAVVIASIVAIFVHISPEFFINIPANPLHGITLPDFHGLMRSPHLWESALMIAVVLTLIDGIESLATIKAIDRIDPYKRKSDPDKTLFAMGVSNVCSSMLGGLTIIPGGVKSTANIMAGGKTQWANFYNASFLLIFMLLFRPIINSLPLAVLAAVLVYTGYKLCNPFVWYKIWKNGKDQFALFSFTALLTISTDLMVGIIGGVLLSLALNYISISYRTKGIRNPLELFKNPVISSTNIEDKVELFINRPLTSFNLIHLQNEIDKVDPSLMQLKLGPKVSLIEHTAEEYLNPLMEALDEQVVAN